MLVRQQSRPLREVGVLFENPFFQRHCTRFRVDQPHHPFRPGQIGNVKVQEAEIAFHDPSRFMLCRQDADAAGRASQLGLVGRIRPESTREVNRNGVVAGFGVARRVVVVVPLRQP